MNIVWFQKCSELRSHDHYNVKLNIITSLEQRKRMLRREKCFRSPSYNRQDIVLATKIVSKLLKNNLQTVTTVIKFQKAFLIHTYQHRVVEHAASSILRSLFAHRLRGQVV